MAETEITEASPRETAPESRQPLLKRRFSRRAVLKGAAIGAAGLASLAAEESTFGKITKSIFKKPGTQSAEATTIPQGEEPAPTPIPEEKPAEISIFQEIMQKIDQSPGTETEKALARETINQFEKAAQRISEFKNDEAQRQAQGEITLWQLTGRKFNRLGDAFPEFTIEDQVFYLKDDKDLQTLLTRLQEAPPQELLTAISQSQNQFFDRGNLGGRRRIAFVTEVAQSPTTEFDLSKTTNPRAPKAAEELKAFLKEIGLEGKIRLKIILADQLSMAKAAGTFSDMGQVPEIELAPPFGEKERLHELTHFLDPDRNSFLHYNLSPEEIIDTLIAIEEALSSEWGRKYPKVHEIFSKDPKNAVVKLQNGQSIEPKEFAAVQRLGFPAGGWLTPERDISIEPDESLVDFMGIFDEQFSQDFDRKLEDALHEIREEDWLGFVSSQKILLDELAQRSDWDKAFVELLRENATSVTYSPRYHGALSMVHLRRILFFDAAIDGDARAAKLLSSLAAKDRKKILDTFLIHWENNDRNLLADGVAVTISGKSELGFKWDETLKNPFKTYFGRIISDLTS